MLAYAPQGTDPGDASRRRIPHCHVRLWRFQTAARPTRPTTSHPRGSPSRWHNSRPAQECVWTDRTRNKAAVLHLRL